VYNPYNFEANTLERLLNSFKEYLYSEKISKGSARSYLSDIRHFFGWLSLFLQANRQQITNQEPVTLLEQVNEKVLEAYQKYQVDNHVPIKTINRRFSSLRRLGSFLSLNTFDTLSNISEEEKPFPEDQYHLEKFRLQLWKNKASKSTIKNYLNDVKQFIEWQEKQ